MSSRDSGSRAKTVKDVAAKDRRARRAKGLGVFESDKPLVELVIS